ncbi:MAG: tRNA(His) guanylyltransferase Thg1 family protein [Myxococcota bacterium]
MSDKTAFGDRMKALEKRESGRRCLPGLPVCARIDGKRFSRWTQGLARPYDPRLSSRMIETTRMLVTETQACIGYTQSDEISLVFWDADPDHQTFLDGRIQKLTSLLASMATAWFNAGLREAIPERADRPALFDCRVWEVPSRAEAANVLLWRERDATKNSVSMAAREHYGHGELNRCSAARMQEMLFAKGVNWNDYPAFFKRGTFVRRETTERRLSPAEREALPPLHAARRDPDLVVRRSAVVAMDMPPFDKVLNREAVVFDGAAPVTAQPLAAQPSAVTS